MNLKRIELTSTSEEELLTTIEENRKMKRRMEEEITRLKEEIHSGEINLDLSEKTILKTNQEEQIEIDTDFEDEINYYLYELKKIKGEDTKEKLIEVLPVKKNYHYKRILLRLQVELLKDIKEFKNMKDDDPDLTISDMEEIKKDITTIEKKRILISEILQGNETEEEQKQENDLIFVPTSGGNIRVLEELDHIDSEYYEGFRNLFLSIKDGTFKNVKRFVSTNRETAGFCEVKDYKIRVVFDRIGPNLYAVLTCFTKKSDNNKGYKEQLTNKIKEYKNCAQSLKSNLENPDFMALQKDYEQELFQKLDTRSKTEVGSEKIK